MNEKKTAEELLQKHLSGMSIRIPQVLTPMIKSAMQEYTAQETADSIQAIDSLTKKMAELMQENERLKEALKDMVSIAEQHYPEELERQYEPRIENAKKLIKADSQEQNRQ